MREGEGKVGEEENGGGMGRKSSSSYSDACD